MEQLHFCPEDGGVICFKNTAFGIMPPELSLIEIISVNIVIFLSSIFPELLNLQLFQQYFSASVPFSDFVLLNDTLSFIGTIFTNAMLTFHHRILFPVHSSYGKYSSYIQSSLILSIFWYPFSPDVLVVFHPFTSNSFDCISSV